MSTRIVLVAGVVAFSAIAHANPAAEKIYRDGKELLAQGKTDEACEAFRRSNELEARVGTLLNLADCEEKRGRFATAWVAWVDARGLATRLGDARATLADQRAAALAPKLSYLTLKIAPTGLAAGLTVRRNGADVPAAELGIEIPLDPGRFELEAFAPGFTPWTKSIDLTPGQRSAIEIPMLVPDGSATTSTTSTSITGTTPPTPPPPGGRSHRIGVGAGIGLSTEADVLYSGRAVVHLAAVGPGTIRTVGSYSFSKLGLDAPYRKATIHALGVGLEYAYPAAPQLIVAAGFGFGVDLFNDEYMNSSTNGWLAGRVSPTLRLPYSIDLGLHLQVVRTSSQTVGLGTLGVDYFFW